MTPFTRQGEALIATFEPAEVAIVGQLATDVQSLLADPDRVGTESPSARAIDRLLPAAYRDEGENDAEFRRFTSAGLTDRKIRNARRVREDLAAGEGSPHGARVNLDADGAQAWLRCLTDIRLTIAAGLGIEHDGDELNVDEHDRYAVEVYGWVGYVQESLLIALESEFS